jgi:hypothetical protein
LGFVPSVLYACRTVPFTCTTLVSGNSMTFNLHYHYRRETCKAICPSFFEAFSDANANLKYVELIMTATSSR